MQRRTDRRARRAAMMCSYATLARPEAPVSLGDAGGYYPVRLRLWTSLASLSIDICRPSSFQWPTHRRQVVVPADEHGATVVLGGQVRDRICPPRAVSSLSNSRVCTTSGSGTSLTTQQWNLSVWALVLPAAVASRTSARSGRFLPREHRTSRPGSSCRQEPCTAGGGIEQRAVDLRRRGRNAKRDLGCHA